MEELNKIMNNPEQPIIFFDGVCGLCNGFVDFIMVHDKKKKFLFSPLQSDFAKSQLPLHLTEDLTSVVLLMNGETYSKSNAVLKVMSELSGPWKLLNLGRYLPLSLRNQVYDLVANKRYKFFGKKETCRLPTEEERQRFII